MGKSLASNSQRILLGLEPIKVTGTYTNPRQFVTFVVYSCGCCSPGPQIAIFIWKVHSFCFTSVSKWKISAGHVRIWRPHEEVRMWIQNPVANSQKPVVSGPWSRSRSSFLKDIKQQPRAVTTTVITKTGWKFSMWAAKFKAPKLRGRDLRRPGPKW